MLCILLAYANIILVLHAFLISSSKYIMFKKKGNQYLKKNNKYCSINKFSLSKNLRVSLLFITLLCHDVMSP